MAQKYSFVNSKGEIIVGEHIEDDGEYAVLKVINPKDAIHDEALVGKESLTPVEDNPQQKTKR